MAKSSNTFIMSWHSYGLESCVDLTELIRASEAFDKEKLFEILKTPDKDIINTSLRDISHIVNSISLRARMNPQRHYEVYLVHTDPGITEEQLTEMFDASPQESAETIRRIGTSLFNGRASKNEQVVIT